MPPLSAALVPAPDQVVVRLTGDADLSTSPLLTDALTRAAGHGTRQVVVDLAGAHIWDCSALHALAAFTSELGAAGRACRVVGALRPTRRLIGAAGLTDRLHLDGPVPAARQPAAAESDRAPARRRGSRHRSPTMTPADAARWAGIVGTARSLRD